MHDLTILASLAGIYFIYIASPGPNFLVITQAAASESRRHGVCTALGVSSASTLLACLAATGLGYLYAHMASLHRLLQFAGGAYLLYIGVKIWRQAGQAMLQRQAATRSRTALAAYRHGLATNLTNPKALVFFTTIFAAVVAPGAPLWLKVSGVAVISLLSTSWNVGVATFFSNARVQRAYGNAKGWINRLTGVLIMSFGLRLLFA